MSFNPTANRELFDNVLSELKKEAENFFKNPPFHQVGSYMDHLLRTGYHSPSSKLAAVQSITFESFSLFVKDWFKNIRFEWLVLGNFDEEIAATTVKRAEAVLAKLPTK